MKAMAFERRAEPLETETGLTGEYHSVEFQPKALGTFYHSRLWEPTPGAPCVLVKLSSRVLPHLTVGDTLAMKYHPVDRSRPDAVVKTRIRHITPEHQGRFKGHVRVGLTPLGPSLGDNAENKV